MTELTPVYNIPYPSESDPWDITMAFQNMAVGVDSAIGTGIKTVANDAARTALFPTPSAGDMCFQIDNSRLYIHNGTAWKYSSFA